MKLPRKIHALAAASLLCMLRSSFGADAPQSQVISVQSAEQKNLITDPELQGTKTAPSHGGAAPAHARSRAAATPDETRLWSLLRKERYTELDAELTRVRNAYPGWSPPARMLALKKEAVIRLRITQSIAAKDWHGVTALARQYPEQFSCGHVDFLWGLAEAWQALGNAQQAAATYQRIVPSCPQTADRIATLQKAGVMLDAGAFAELLQREEQASQRSGQGGAEHRARLEQIAYEFQVRQFLDSVAAKDLTRAIGLIENFQAALKARRDARNAALIGWVYFDAGEFETSATWFGGALAWEPALEDARYGHALANFRLDRLDDAEATLRIAKGDDARNLALRSDIAYARALKAYEVRDYKASLNFLDATDAKGANSRDVAMLRAWSRYQLGDSIEAARMFTDLYRQQADSESAQGAVSSLSRSQRWNELAELAGSLGGPLEEKWKAGIAQRFYDRKLFLAAEGSAPGKTPQLQNIAASGIAVTAMVRDKSGEDGKSRLRLTRAPYAEGVTVFENTHELRLQLSRVMLDSGNLPANAAIGSYPAAGAYVTSPTTRLGSGFEPTLLYRHQGLLTTYASVGLTPSGAALSSAPIGNLGVMQQVVGGNWRAEIFSQPVRESMLSYTGIVDPYTGQSWGRVRKTGALAGAYTALGSGWGASGKVQAVDLEGKNVAGNQGMSLSLALARDLTLHDFDYFTVGPDLSYDAYRKNLSHFTLGHGGYFSPERLLSIGLSARFVTPEARQYIIKGDFSIGLFDKREAASPCFPEDNSRPVNPACTYAQSSASGSYYSAQLMGVRRLSDSLQVGGAVVFRRSPQYDDKTALIFLRYIFNPRNTVMSSDLPEQMLQSLY